MKYKPIWYDQDSVKHEDPPVEANSEEEARSKAYLLHNGNPPAPMLSLMPIE